MNLPPTKPQQSDSRRRLLPLTAVIPTIDRPRILKRMLDSLVRQEAFPTETIVIDASNDNTTAELIEGLQHELPNAAMRWIRADSCGAAVQRNQGCAMATQQAILFLDDDVLLEPHCLATMWSALQSDAELGGVSATITNQRYVPPGLVSRNLFWLMNGRRESSYAGKILGPAVNLLPEDCDELPPVVVVDWLHLGCTLYKRNALPEPPFDSFFTGYSMLEDATLSIRVGKKWKLANARTARIFHDSQPGAHKSDIAELSCMEFVNRHYLMTQVLGRSGIWNHFRLVIWELFQIAACAADASTRSGTAATVVGKARAVVCLLKKRHGAGRVKIVG